MKYTAEDLFELLNEQDECPWIEAKGGSESSHSVMETVCSFSNEPGLGGGYILIGVAVDVSVLFPQYKIVGVNDPDKLQRDFATQCAGMFNIPVRPEFYVEKINGITVVKVWVNEVPARMKPVYFTADGLPGGALRRIGSTDQHCTEDDMHVFYQDSTSFDQTPVKGITIDAVDENAMQRYRSLRGKVNPAAEELTYNDGDLLQSLGCTNREKPNELNIAGLLLFGKSSIHRSTFPMLRVDYIRVPGNQWISDPDDRFTTIDMRGPLLLILYRLIDAINADLPKGFLLPEENLQATPAGLPLKALREAIVNALMHRSYREHRPTQVIRYDNRIEIRNPGFSLKSEENLGLPGSETRNPFIAAVFHDTNLAETKGSGIRAMRKLMQAAHLVPPTFESSRENNEFVARLLLHHFLDETDLEWLKQFESLNLSDPQKQALIFVREVGAIDNQTYRQMADCDTLKASNDLRMLKTNSLFASKGKGKATYYIAGVGLSTEVHERISTEPGLLNTEPTALNTGASDVNTEAELAITEAGDVLSTEANAIDRMALLNELPKELEIRILELKGRESNPSKVKEVIKEICDLKPRKLVEIASILQKGDNYISRKYIKPMIDSGELRFQFPEMINHPDQAYLTPNK